MHDMQTPHPPPALDEAREQEEQYFNKTSVWKELPRLARSRLGSRRLVLHLEEILSGLISARYARIYACSILLMNNVHVEFRILSKKSRILRREPIANCEV
jgi:hypothetical protein